jgi:putative FmdB family regulatory protein
MPIYEYRCSDCGHELEALQKLSEPRLVNCPACHADALVKKVSAAGFQLKGSGWYVTDFRNGNKTSAKPKSDDKPAASDAAPAAAGEATKSDSTTKSDGPSGNEGASSNEKSTKPAESKPKADPVPAKPAAAPSGSSTT